MITNNEHYLEIANEHFKKYCEIFTFDSREEWLKLRMNGIGGSDVSAILGHNKFRSPKDVYESKFIEKEQISNYAIDYGNFFENLLFKTFQWKYSSMYATLDYKDILFRNIFAPCLQASVDGVLVEKGTNKVGLLEIKTAQNKKTKWYYDNGEKGVPQEYIDQAIHYFITTGVDFVIFYVQIDTQNRDDIDRDSEILKPRRINREDVLDYMEVVEKEVINFWESYVVKHIEPPKRLVF